MQLSLVICTRNRAPQLAESLQSLLKLQSSASWELIIVDNGSNDETEDVINNYKGSLCLKTVYEPRAGLGKARNRGWAISQADIVAFTDDDCYPAHDFLSSVARCFEENPRLGFIGGRILLHDPKDYRVTIQERACRQDLCPNEFLPTGLIQGANFACRRVALQSVGGFDERFGAGALFPCEEVDALARMLARGWQGAYDPRPLVYHHHRRRTKKQAYQLMGQYDRGRGAYYVKSILNPALRSIYFRNWCCATLRQSPATTARELVAGVEFLFRAFAAQFYPIVNRGLVRKNHAGAKATSSLRARKL
jgi:glycosyltransferase involved in cell wall biosynthesis